MTRVSGFQEYPSYDFEGSPSMPSNAIRDTFHYVPPSHENKPKKKKNIKGISIDLPDIILFLRWNLQWQSQKLFILLLL